VLKQFLNHIGQTTTVKNTDKILLAVSGGMDSMVMADLFIKAGFSIGVAHCNFQLRGEESEADTAFVREYAARHRIPFFLEYFDTKSQAQNSGVSIQQVARTLRYEFFERIATQEGFNYIATAHHADDDLETFLLNFVRGTGIDGLSGMPAVRGKIIRPMLFLSREDIRHYASAHSISWREDSSNTMTDYSRNFLRLQVIPRLLELNPGLGTTFLRTRERMAGARHFAEQYKVSFEQHHVSKVDGRTFIDKKALHASRYPSVLLWELVKPHGFRFEQCDDIVRATEFGKWVTSGRMVLLNDRDKFVLQTITSEEADAVVVVPGVCAVLFQEEMTGIEVNPESNVFNSPPTEAFLDFNKLVFPLTWRKWRDGDAFQPLGMRGQKKVSDFLIDLKIDRLQKERVTVLESAGTIVWVVGLRIAEPFKITSETTRTIRFRVARR